MKTIIERQHDKEANKVLRELYCHGLCTGINITLLAVNILIYYNLI